MPVSSAELVKNERRNYGNPLFPVFLFVGHDCTQIVKFCTSDFHQRVCLAIMRRSAWTRPEAVSRARPEAAVSQARPEAVIDSLYGQFSVTKSKA